MSVKLKVITIYSCSLQHEPQKADTFIDETTNTLPSLFYCNHILHHHLDIAYDLDIEYFPK